MVIEYQINFTLCIYAVLFITDAQEFYDELSEVTDWIKFGRVLGISYSQLIQVDISGCNAAVKYGCVIFEEWKKVEKPTWAKAVTSLFLCEMNEVGTKVAKKHSKYVSMYLHIISLVLYGARKPVPYYFL